MTDYPGGVTREQYIAVLREAAKMVCTFCQHGEKLIVKPETVYHLFCGTCHAEPIIYALAKLEAHDVIP